MDEGRGLSLAELVSLLEERLEMEVSLLNFRSKTLYSSLVPPARQREWMGMSLRDVAEEAVGQRVADPTIFLQANCYDDDSDEDVDLPTVAYLSP